MEICERVSGARMHTAMYKPYGFDRTILVQQLGHELVHFLTRCSRSLAGAFLGLLANRSFKSRLSFIGQVAVNHVTAYGVTGLIARSVGVVMDMRLQAPWGGVGGIYRFLSLRAFIGRRGDNFDRFLLRVKEVVEGFRLMTQLLSLMVVRAAGVLSYGCDLGYSLHLRGLRWFSGCGAVFCRDYVLV
jgi:NADH-quinone oxidoreductase subunit D